MQVISYAGDFMRVGDFVLFHAHTDFMLYVLDFMHVGDFTLYAWYHMYAGYFMYAEDFVPYALYLMHAGISYSVHEVSCRMREISCSLRMGGGGHTPCEVCQAYREFHALCGVFHVLCGGERVGVCVEGGFHALCEVFHVLCGEERVCVCVCV